MAHNLAHSRSMFWSGEAPWHNLGVQLPANATWEQVCAAVDFYKVEEREVFAAGIPEALKDKKALLRADTGAYLSVVGKDYCPVDFDEMAKAVVVGGGGVEAIFHTGGLLGKNGIRGWLLGELPEPIRVKGDESEIRKYFLATTAHDGWHSVVLMNTGVRVVCQNTLGAALSEREGARWSIRHTKNAKQAVEEAGKAFRNLASGYEKFGALANLLVSTPFGDRAFEATLDRLMPVPEDGATKALEEKREKLTGLYQGAAKGTTSGIAGTAWQAFQAWTEFADWHRPVRSLAAQNPAARLDSIWFGGAADLKKDALHAIATEAAIPLRTIFARAS